MSADYSLQIWNNFCDKQNIFNTGVHLFDGKESVSIKEVGKDKKRLILRRSEEMNQLIISEVEKVLEDYRKDTKIYDGLIYMMYRENQNQITPLYIGKSEKFGRNNGNLSANIKNIARDSSKFCRWGDNYAYHIGDLSAVVLGHDLALQISKYKNWAKTLFEYYPSDKPKLNFPVKFWIKAWRSDDIGIWEELGSTNLTFLEYLLIGVASKLFPNDLLNSEGVNRKATVEDISQVAVRDATAREID